MKFCLRKIYMHNPSHPELTRLTWTVNLAASISVRAEVLFSGWLLDAALHSCYLTPVSRKGDGGPKR